MTNLQMWSLLVGFLAPPLIAIVQQPKWGAGLRSVVTVIMCLIFGGATAYFEGSGDSSDRVGAVLLVTVAAMTFYKRFWTPTKIAPKLEAATSPSAHVENVFSSEPAAVEGRKSPYDA